MAEPTTGMSDKAEPMSAQERLSHFKMSIQPYLNCSEDEATTVWAVFIEHLEADRRDQLAALTREQSVEEMALELFMVDALTLNPDDDDKFEYWINDLDRERWYAIARHVLSLLAAHKDAARVEAQWQSGDDAAKSGDVIEAAFAYTNTISGRVAWEYVIVHWEDEARSWIDSAGDIYDGPSDELPTWYRAFIAPPARARTKPRQEASGAGIE